MRGKDREIDPVVLQKTLEILRARFHPDQIDIDSVVYLSEPERRNILLRVSLSSSSDSVPKSIILKQSLPQQSDTNDKNADARFFRDWAGLEFASKMQQKEGTQNTPIFYGSDKALRFIIIEDLGSPHTSLVDSLAPAIPDKDKAVSALSRYMQALGRFNASSFGQTNIYRTILQSINPEATNPLEDLESLSNVLHPQLLASVKSIDLIPTLQFTEEAQHVLDSIFKPGPFTVLTHGDIAPDNVFDHEEPKGLQLIDFEWSSPRNALLDGTYLRMSMPTAWFAKTIPEHILKPLELMYRNELKKTIPEASNDLAYSRAYTHACAFNILHEISRLPEILDSDKIWSTGPVPQNSLWNPETNSVRSRFLTRLQTFIDVVNEHDKMFPYQPAIVPELRIMAENMLVKVKTLWPKSTPLETYPAFKNNTQPLNEPTQTYKTILSDIKDDGDHHGSFTPTPTKTSPKLPWE